MKLLLDTHIYLWCVNDDRKLSKKARALIVEASEVYVSSVCIWEASIKAQLGKLDVNIKALTEAIAHSGFLELPLSIKHAIAVHQLPNLHRDPFDRILVAQALSEPLRLVTADEKLKSYSEIIEIV